MPGLRRWLALALLAQPLADTWDMDSREGKWLPSATADPRRPVFRSDLASVRDTEFEVVRGQSIEVILTATVPTTQTPEFFLRSQPQSGTVTAPEPVEGEPLKARVRYSIGADTTAVTDQFSFAARLPGGPMSAAATVRIRILEPRAVLQAEPLVLENIPVGQTATGMLSVTNSGNAPWRGVLQLPEPWRAPAGPIEIPHGERVDIPVTFQPTAIETFRHEFLWQSEHAGSNVLLVGRGVAAFTLRPDRRLVLAQDPASGRRSGVLRIESPAPVTIRLESDEAERFGLPETISPNGTEPVEIPLVLDANDLAPLATTVVAASEFMSVTLAVEADAIRGQLEIQELPGEGVIDLGRMRNGDEATRTLVLLNKGGAGLRLRFEAESPAFVSAPAGSVELGPGETIDLVIGLRPNRIGPMQKRISIDTGAGVRSFALLAEVEPREVEASAVVVPRMGGGGEVSWADVIASGEEDEALRYWAAAAVAEGVRLEALEIDRSLPEIASLEIKAVGRRSLDLQWPTAASGAGRAAQGYMVEIARVMPHPETGEPGYFWLTVPERHFKWKTSRDGRMVDGRVSGLPPLGPVTARIAVRSPAGTVGPASPTVRAITKSSRRIPWGTLGFSLLLVIGASLGFLVWRQRRQA